MFCTNCGTNNLEVARYCENCGQPLKVGGMGGGGREIYIGGTKKTSKSPVLPILFGCVGIIAVAVAAVILFTMYIGTPETPIKNLVKAMNTGELDYALEALPNEMEDVFKNPQKYSTGEGEEELVVGIIENMDVQFKEQQTKMKNELIEEFGQGEFKYDINNKTKLGNTEISNTQKMLDELNKSGELKKDMKVTDGYKMSVSIMWEGSRGQDINTEDVFVYKINGKWCLMDGAGGLESIM